MGGVFWRLAIRDRTRSLSPSSAGSSQEQRTRLQTALSKKIGAMSRERRGGGVH